MEGNGGGSRKEERERESDKYYNSISIKNIGEILKCKAKDPGQG